MSNANTVSILSVSKLDSYVLQGKGFENYRYRIIQFMKYIRDNQLYLAKEIYNELVKIIPAGYIADAATGNPKIVIKFLSNFLLPFMLYK